MAIQAPSSPDFQFKALYLLAVFMVVDGHIGSFDWLALNGLMAYQNYHIALFMFASGYFLNIERSYGEFIKRKTLRLIFPLLGFNLLYGLLCYILNTYFGFTLGEKISFHTLFVAPFTDGHQFIYNMASWFIAPLFFVQLISFLLLKPAAECTPTFLPKTAVLFFALALILGISALSFAPTGAYGRDIRLAVLRTFYFLPSFAFGFLYRHLLQKYDRLPAFLSLPLTLALIFTFKRLFPYVNHIPSWLQGINEPPLIIYAVSFLSIYFWLKVSGLLAPLIAKSAILLYIASHTFDIMMHHFLGFILIKQLYSALDFPGFDSHRAKTDIWYNFFPDSAETSSLAYISITIVIALLTGFTIRKFCARIIQIFKLTLHLKKKA